MLYIWSYLKRYPKWLVLDFLGAIFFVIVKSRFTNSFSPHD